VYIPRVTAPAKRRADNGQGAGMDIVAVLLALVVFALMLGLIRVMERI
jgi:hypothetical protein